MKAVTYWNTHSKYQTEVATEFLFIFILFIAAKFHEPRKIVLNNKKKCWNIKNCLRYRRDYGYAFYY